MKKRKLNLFLNVAVICLCFASICFGVYSAKTASLNVSGTIGFNAHNCSVEVSGTYSCYEQETGSQITDSALWSSAFTVGGADASNTQISKSIDKVLTFSDLNGSATGGNASYEQQATIKLKIVNKSDFTISVNTSKPIFSNATTSQYVKTGVDVSEVILAKSEECYITYTFTLTISADTVEINSVNGGYTIDITFNKSTSSDSVPTNLFVVDSNTENVDQSWFDEKKKTYEGIKITNGVKFTLTQGDNIELKDFVIVCESGKIYLQGGTLAVNANSYILINGAGFDILNGTIIAKVSNVIRVIDSASTSNTISQCSFDNQVQDSTMFYIKNSKLTLNGCMMSDGSKKFNIQLKNGSELYLNACYFDSTSYSITKDSSSKYYIDGEEK